MTDPHQMDFAIALGGGSARGWAHVGVLRLLDERGVVPNAVAGTSIGSIVGAAYAAGEIDRLERLGRKWFASRGGGGLLDFLDVGFRLAFDREQQLVSFLGELFGDDDRRIEDLPKPFAAVATDLDTGARVVLRHGPLLEALLASSALPGVLPPRRVGGRTLVDGGLSDPVPINEALVLGGTKVLAVDLHGASAERDAREKGDRSIVDVISSSLAIMQRRLTRWQLADHLDAFVVRPPLGTFRWYELHRLDEALASGRETLLGQWGEFQRWLVREPEENGER